MKLEVPESFMTTARFGDIGDDGEERYHTLEKLKCYGFD